MHSATATTTNPTPRRSNNMNHYNRFELTHMETDALLASDPTIWRAYSEVIAA